MATIDTLYGIISAVAPIHGVAVGSWSDKATWRIDFDPSATVAQRSAAQTVVTNFNPNGPQATAQETFNAAILAGITLTWTVSTALNDTYQLDETTQIRMLAERLSVSINGTFWNGTTTLQWAGLTGTRHTLSLAQAGLFIAAVWKYLTALFDARATAAAGNTPTWPSPNVTITG